MSNGLVCANGPPNIVAISALGRPWSKDISACWVWWTKWPNNVCWSGPRKRRTPTLNLTLIEHHPQRVLEAFRRGEFDQIEIIGQADEKEFFELCFHVKIFSDLVKVMFTDHNMKD